MCDDGLLLTVGSMPFFHASIRRKTFGSARARGRPRSRLRGHKRAKLGFSRLSIQAESGLTRQTNVVQALMMRLHEPVLPGGGLQPTSGRRNERLRRRSPSEAPANPGRQTAQLRIGPRLRGKPCDSHAQREQCRCSRPVFGMRFPKGHRIGMNGLHTLWGPGLHLGTKRLSERTYGKATGSLHWKGKRRLRQMRPARPRIEAWGRPFHWNYRLYCSGAWPYPHGA